jgi:hypothetical protein
MNSRSALPAVSPRQLVNTLVGTILRPLNEHEFLALRRISAAQFANHSFNIAVKRDHYLLALSPIRRRIRKRPQDHRSCCATSDALEHR